MDVKVLRTWLNLSEQRRDKTTPLNPRQEVWRANRGGHICLGDYTPEFSVPVRRMNEFSKRNQAGVVRANDRVRNQHGKTWKVNEWLFDYSEI